MAIYPLNPTCKKPSVTTEKGKRSLTYVYFSYRNLDNQRRQFKVYEGLNDADMTKAERNAMAKEFINNYDAKLKSRKFDVTRKQFIGDVIEDMKIDTYLDIYIKEQESTSDPNSFRTYKYVLETFKKQFQGRTIRDISADDISDYFLEKGWLSNTRKYHKTNIGSFFIWLKKRYKITIENPASGVVIGKKDVTDIHSVLSENEFELIMAEAAKTDAVFSFALKMIYNCLVRPIELSRIKIRDIQLDRNAIFLPKGQGKNRKMSRYLIIDSWFKPDFDNLGIDFQDPAIQDNYLISISGHSLILNGKEKVDTARYNRRFNAIRKKLNISESKSMYGLKHLNNIHLKLKHKLDTFDVQIRNGHRTQSQTESYQRELLSKAPEILSR